MSDKTEIEVLREQLAAAEAKLAQVREWHATLRAQRLYDELGDILADASPVSTLDAVRATDAQSDNAQHSYMGTETDEWL